MDAYHRVPLLEQRWSRLAERYLPVVTPGSPWRYSRGDPRGLPAEGWKLHLSATTLTAAEVLRRSGPVLESAGASFKGPAQLAFLARLNSGVDAFSQVGKCLTVYCPDGSTARCLASRLHEAIGVVAGPIVPYDLRYLPNSNVYYRYGAFGAPSEPAGGTITGPDGGRTADRREPGSAVPAWISNPFPPLPAAHPPDSRLAVDFRVFRLIRARGKGGVYLGLDLTVAPARLCVVKEGLRHGETDIAGHDGRWMVRHEGRLLRHLRRAGVPVPPVRAQFTIEDNAYLVTGHVEGPTLAAHLRRRRRPAAADARLALELVDLLARIHAAGVAWRDCKPDNLVLTPAGLVALDFEGAWRPGEPPSLPWGTPPYRAPLDPRPVPPWNEDIYSLGVVLKALLRGPALKVAADVVDAMTSANPRSRPALRTIRRHLVKAL